MAKPETVFIYIGTYPSEAAARDDYGVVKDLHAADAVGTYDAVSAYDLVCRSAYDLACRCCGGLAC